MKTLTVGLCDDYYLALMSYLAAVDNCRLVVYVAGVAPHDESAFLQPGPWCGYRKARKLSRVGSLQELIDARCDLYITRDSDPECAFEVLRSLGRNVIGWSHFAQVLERDRSYAKRVLSSSGADIYLPESRVFWRKDDALKYLRGLHARRVVLKLASAAQEQLVSRRTIVAETLGEAATLLERNPVWFDESGNGGVLIEEYIAGQEVCWGAWFNGEAFVGPMYSCVEHKGAQNGDRGGVLTGEVGTPMTFHTREEGGPWQTFDALAPVLRGQCCGLVDINTVLMDDGRLAFLEFTMRFGRPTLEMLLAMARDGGLAQNLLSLAQGRHDSFARFFRSGFGVGVSVFPYGYPFGDGVDTSDNSLFGRMEFSMPATDLARNVTVPIFASWQRGNTWCTYPNDRQFLVSGFGDTPEAARSAAYAPLANYRLYGHTWRDDVGVCLPDLYANMKKHGLLK